ncbi:MAG: PA14 domain-containing protein, partial [Planctomycetota bacterium]
PFGDETWGPNTDGGLTLAYETDYYWRIDEMHGSFIVEQVKGKVWKFTTVSEFGGLRGNYYQFDPLAAPIPPGFPPLPWEAFNDTTFELTRIDPVVNFQWGGGATPGIASPDPCIAVDDFAARWVGRVEAGWTQTYTFTTATDDGTRVWVDDELIINQWIQQGTTNVSGTIDLVAGEKYPIVFEFYEHGGGANAQLFWSAPTVSNQIIPSGALNPPDWAYDPDPAHNSTTVDPTEFIEVTWTEGDNTDESRVYWGTSPGSLSLVATLAFDTDYYFRIDEANGSDVWTGKEWTFRTVREPSLGSIIGEIWRNLPTGTNLESLTDDPRFPYNPDNILGEMGEMDKLDTEWYLPSNELNQYGGRVHGWLIPKTSGNHRFWICTDDPGNLYLNRSGPDPTMEPEDLIAYIPNGNWADPYVWDTHTTQDSNNVVGTIYLEGGQRYYIGALWKEGGGGDHCQVAWQGPDQPDGYYLAPFTRLWASEPFPRNREVLSAEEVTELFWTAGIKATGHKFWLDDDPNVTDAPLIFATLPLASNSVDPTTYAVTIEWEKKYYWKVTEVNSITLEEWEGPVWSFTTTNYAYPEDFERYNKTGPSSGDPDALRYRWKDGFSTFPVPGSASNVMLGGDRDEPPRPYLHYNDYRTHSDDVTHDQALVLYYDNDGNTFVPGYYDWQGYGYPAPKYSEIEALTTGTDGIGLGQDWSRSDLKALSLWFKGFPRRTGSFQQNTPSPSLYTIISDGADIWNVGPNPYHDEFHYGYNDLLKGTNWAGLGIITARVDSISNTHDYTKAGVMMRESALPDCNYVAVVLRPATGVGGQVSVTFRDVKRGASTETNIDGISAPHWVRLERDSFGRFVATHANDVEAAASNWQAIGPPAGEVVDMDPNILAGLCLTSHNANAMATAVFSNVSISPSGGSTVGPGWQNRDIGIITNEPPHPRMYVAVEDVLTNVAVLY